MEALFPARGQLHAGVATLRVGVSVQLAQVDSLPDYRMASNPIVNQDAGPPPSPNPSTGDDATVGPPCLAPVSKSGLFSRHEHNSDAPADGRSATAPPRTTHARPPVSPQATYVVQVSWFDVVVKPKAAVVIVPEGAYKMGCWFRMAPHLLATSSTRLGWGQERQLRLLGDRLQGRHLPILFHKEADRTKDEPRDSCLAAAPWNPSAMAMTAASVCGLLDATMTVERCS